MSNLLSYLLLLNLFLFEMLLLTQRHNICLGQVKLFETFAQLIQNSIKLKSIFQKNKDEDVVEKHIG